MPSTSCHSSTTSTTSRPTTPSPSSAATPSPNSHSSATPSPISPTKSQQKKCATSIPKSTPTSATLPLSSAPFAPPSPFKLCNPCGTANPGCALTTEPHLTNSIPRRTSFTFRGSALCADPKVFPYVTRAARLGDRKSVV